MRVNLKVPFRENWEVKKFGARWDGELKTWYVKDIENLAPFLKWIPAHLTKPHGKGAK